MNSLSSPAERSSAPTAARSHSDGTRVLHVNSGNLYGGVETILVTLARLRHLCKTMEPHFALCHEGRLSQELRETGVSVHTLGKVRISRPWTVWGARHRLREILRRERFDLVICHMPWSLAVFGGTVRSEGRKLGFWAHAYHSGEGWLERLARPNNPDVAIGNSYFTEAGLTNLFPGVPHKVIYPPVALIEAREAHQWRTAVRKQQGVSEEMVVIVQVSRLEKCKGHLLHAQALAQLKSLRIPWKWWVVGGAQRPEEQEYLKNLRRAVEELGLAGCVNFLGQRTDVPQLLAGADVFCQPNHTPDSFGISFIEALWAGRPVITTALGGAREIIDDSCGLLVPPGDAAALAESLRRMIESPELRETFGRGGAARALRLCDPSTQMRMLSDVSRSWQEGTPQR